MIKQQEYCDSCEEVIDPTHRFAIAQLPVSIPHAYQEESATVCLRCFCNIFEYAVEELNNLRHKNCVLLHKLNTQTKEQTP